MNIMIGVIVVASFVAAAVLFLRRNAPRVAASPDAFMRDMASEAVSAAKDECGVTLDYSLDSVQRVEEILGRLHESYAKSEDKRGMHGYAIAYGAYIGECLKRHIGRGHWERDHAAGGEKSWPFVWEDGDHVSFPYGWCGRRIQNGPEDNVWFKLQVILAQETNSQSQASQPIAAGAAQAER